MWERWQPGSRRDRRRSRGSSRRSGTGGADRNFLIVAGLFVLGVAVVVGLFLLLVSWGG